MEKRRQELRDLYGLDFPDDFFRFWQFVNRLRPLEPLNALDESLGITLVGPFEVLAGRFDKQKPRRSMVLHWRYYNDPPEFFTVLAGDTDGLHWGYYWDDSREPPGCVASYFARDSYELSMDGCDLFEAVRLAVEYSFRDCLEAIEEDPDHAGGYRRDLEQIDAVRAALKRFATADRDEESDAYIDKYSGCAAREAKVVAATHEGMGVVVPPELYRPSGVPDEKLWKRLYSSKQDPKPLVEEAMRALREGYPATALKLGKDLWATTWDRNEGYAYELLEAAYDALGRGLLKQVMLTHRENRDLPSLDILENE